MSLAWRILLVVLLLNLVVVGGLQTALFAVQAEWMRQRQSEILDATVVPFLLRVYSGERLADTTQVRELVGSPEVRDFFDDIVVTRGRPYYSSVVFLNPRGSVHRDPDQFSMEEVRGGMQRAEGSRGLVRVADGYCRAVWRGDELAGYLYFVPKQLPAAAFPWWISGATVLFGTVLFGALLYWIVVRTVGRPLHRIGDAASQVGKGSYDVRLPELAGVPELTAVARSFNSMAAKVQGHTRDLERAVEQAVAETEEKQRALVLSSRLAAIGTLAAGIAHEINNPIGGMQNAVNRLLQTEGLTDRQRTYLSLLQDGLARVARTARRVLNFSPRSVEARPFSIRDAVQSAAALAEHRMQQQGARLVVDIPPDLPQVAGDEHELQQVFLNLFLNSLDAFGQSQDGGAGCISVSSCVYSGEGPSRVRTVIRDDGPGMAKEDLPRVLDPFFTRKDRPDASGLGMFISYSIVQNHGGEMVVDSAVGDGFTVTIDLPLAEVAPGGVES